MSEQSFRIERDSMGEINVPKGAYYGAQTQCAVSASAFTDKCVDGIVADRAGCEEMVERRLAMATAPAPVIGYESAAKIAQEALVTGQTIRQLAQRKDSMAQEKLKKLLDPWSITKPGISGKN